MYIRCLRIKRSRKLPPTLGGFRRCFVGRSWRGGGVLDMVGCGMSSAPVRGILRPACKGSQVALSSIRFVVLQRSSPKVPSRHTAPNTIPRPRSSWVNTKIILRVLHSTCTWPHSKAKPHGALRARHLKQVQNQDIGRESSTTSATRSAHSRSRSAKWDASASAGCASGDQTKEQLNKVCSIRAHLFATPPREPNTS